MTNIIEIWKDIPGYEGYYKASSLGRIKKMPYITKNRVGGLMQKEERIIKPTKSKKGYLKTRLYLSPTNFKPYSVHRLIAITFLSPPDKSMDQVNHINGLKDDNRASNLEWSNNSHNIKHAWANGLHKPNLPKGTGSPHAVIVLHKEYGIYSTILEASFTCSLNRSIFSKMVHNKIYNSTKYIKV